MKLKKYIERLVTRGRYFFTLKEIEENLDLSKGSLTVSISRLKKMGDIASPAKGYYIIIPLEFRSIGSLPPDNFIPDLMEFLETPYYVCLLSACMYYGASHQQPQSFQVMVQKARKAIQIGQIRVEFHMNKYLTECPVQLFNTPRSILRVSSPEATAFDLIAYPKASAGFSNILTILSELVESMSIEEFSNLLKTHRELPVIQRLGYLMEMLQQKPYTKVLEDHLKGKDFNKAVLNPLSSCQTGKISKRWKLIINDQIESDL